MNAYTDARAALRRTGAKNATGDALALCYANAIHRSLALSERACFEALRLKPDSEKLATVRKWKSDPFTFFDDLPEYAP